MKYIYIVNGRPDKAAQYQDFYDQLKLNPHPYEVYTTLGEGDATRYVRLYCDLHPEEEVCFVACGGNGIINGVASGLVGYAQSSLEAARQCENKTMAVLYFAGATEDFIINFPGRNFRSVKDMLEGTVTPTDIIQVNDSYCLNVCNIGFNSKVASRANELVEKGKSAHEAYTRGVINAILTSRYGRRVGGEFNCAPDARLDDGLMDVCYFRTMSLLRLLMLIPHYRTGTHIGSRVAGKRVLFRHALEVVISSKDLIDIYLDGEQLPGSQFHLKVLPGALPLRLPKIEQ